MSNVIIKVAESKRLRKGLVRITPMIRRAIGLLSLSRRDLIEFIKNEMEKNPLLEVESQDLFSGFGSSNRASHIDILVRKMEGRFRVIFNSDGIPHLRIRRLNEECFRINDDKLKLLRKLNSARWLIGSLKRREKILYDVAVVVVETQKDFLDEEAKFLQPLTVKEVAKILDLHPSTVSRVTTNKFIKTEKRVFRLKDFFKRPVAKRDDKNISSESLKEAIKGLIDSEGCDRALKDYQIQELLLKKGIVVSRRTVAQYRKVLGIPSYRNRLNKKEE